MNPVPFTDDLLTTRLHTALLTLKAQGKIASIHLPGMRVRYSETGASRLMDGVTPPSTFIPDPTDPLTVQALLLLLREASGDPGAVTMMHNEHCWFAIWRVHSASWRGDPCTAEGVTEADAVVSALEMAAAVEQTP